MGQPLVSVIIPAYNSGARIRETIESALKQTYPRIEIVVVDDASVDATWDTLQQYKSSSVRLFRNNSNQGLSASRNRAIEMSQGEYIALLDHDDLWNPEKIEKQMRLFEKNPELGLVFSDSFCVDLQGRQWRYFQFYPPSRGKVLDRLIKKNFVPCPTIIYPKSVLEGRGTFDPKFTCGEELELCLRIARRYPVDFVDEPLATYRIHESNFSSDIVNAQEKLALLKIYSGEIPLDGLIAVYQLFLCRLCIKKRRLRQAFYSLSRGLWQVICRPGQFVQALGEFLQTRRSQRKQLISLLGRC